MPCGAPTTSIRAILLLMMGGLMGLALAGCGPSAEEQKRAELREDFRDSFAHRDPNAGATPSVSHPERVLVARGRSPVVYQVRNGAKVHVSDLTAGAEIAAFVVDGDQMMSVSENTGVSLGKQVVLHGPLPDGHEFGILLEVGGDERFQSAGGIDAVPATPPTRYETTTQPAVQPRGQVGNH